jgi:hypothetical protein
MSFSQKRLVPSGAARKHKEKHMARRRRRRICARVLGRVPRSHRVRRTASGTVVAYNPRQSTRGRIARRCKSGRRGYKFIFGTKGRKRRKARRSRRGRFVVRVAGRKRKKNRHGGHRKAHARYHRHHVGAKKRRKRFKKQHNAHVRAHKRFRKNQRRAAKNLAGFFGSRRFADALRAQAAHPGPFRKSSKNATHHTAA